MKRKLNLLMAILVSLLLIITATTASAQSQVSKVDGFPSAEQGYSLGVSACYAGTIGKWMVMAGGCNFPTKGNKKYYAGIYAAPINGTTLNWQLIGMLPEPAAYGVTVACGDSLLMIGGCNNEHSLATVYSIHLNADGSKAHVNKMANMPVTADNMAAAKCGDKVYVVGGNQNGKPSADVLCADIHTNGAWNVVATMPGSPRVQPVCAAYNNKVYVWGGFFANGESSVVNTDGCCLDTKTAQWSMLKAPRSMSGEEMTLSGGIAWSDGKKIYATGGVCKDIFLDAISGRYERVKQKDYLLQPIEWYRFSGNLYVYDAARNQWNKTKLAHNSLARAGAAAVPTAKGVYYIGGELKPALRTPQIVLIK